MFQELHNHLNYGVLVYNQYSFICLIYIQNILSDFAGLLVLNNIRKVLYICSKCRLPKYTKLLLHYI
jgi:hypothetical protein